MRISMLVAFVCPAAAHASRRARSSVPFLVSKKSRHAHDSILKLRGGDLGPIGGAALAKTFGVLAIGDAVAGSIRPAEVWEEFGVSVEPGSKGEHYLGHGLAASAATLSVTSLLALSGKTSVDEAIGYGLLARCAFLTEMLLTNKYKELGASTTPHVLIYAILLGTAYGLLSGDWDSSGAAKAVSIVLAGHGALLYLNPRILGDDNTKKMAKVDGGYMFISSLYAALLAFGVDPVKAMGYTAIFAIPLFQSIIDLSTADKILGLSPGGWTIALVVFVGASAYGMLT